MRWLLILLPVLLVGCNDHTNQYVCPDSINLGDVVEHKTGNVKGVVIKCDNSDGTLRVDTGNGYKWWYYHVVKEHRTDGF